MRFLISFTIPTEHGNKLIKEGKLLKQLPAYLGNVKPEATYFTIDNGKRTVFMIVNVESSEKIPEIAEPLWLDWHAEVKVIPVMNEKDFEKAGPGIQRVIDRKN